MNDAPASPAIDRSPGALDLALELAGGRTRPARCVAVPPVQLSRARYDDPGDAAGVAMTLVHLGGILQGDRYDLRVELGPGACARITTAAATQVYRMERDGAAQRLSLRLAPGSRLAWLPEPLILFGGADFTQETVVTLGAGARLDLLDVLAPGRLARGERDRYRRYAAALEVRAADGRLLAAERAVLEPERHSPAAPGVFGATPVVGSLFVLGDRLDAERAVATAGRIGRGLAATTLPNHAGLLVRALGDSASGVRSALLEARRRLIDEDV